MVSISEEQSKEKYEEEKDELVQPGGFSLQSDTHHPQINIINTHLPQSHDLKHNVCVDKTNTNTHTAKLIRGRDHGSFKEFPARTDIQQQY